MNERLIRRAFDEVRNGYSVDRVLVDPRLNRRFLAACRSHRLKETPARLTESELLYVGETENLRRRIEKHLDHSDNKHLARWLWGNPSRRLFIEPHLLHEATTNRVRRALEAELISSRKPTFNVPCD